MARSSGQPRTEYKPLLVEVLAYAPTQFFHCQHCELVWQQAGASATQEFHKETLASSLPPEMQKEYADLSAWVLQTVETYGGRVLFKIIDAASFEGLLKSARYGTRRYPAFVVGGKGKYIGTNFDQARHVIDQQLEATGMSVS